MIKRAERRQHQRHGVLLTAIAITFVFCVAGCGSGAGLPAAGDEMLSVNPSILDNVVPDGTTSESGLVIKDVTTGFTPGEPYRKIDTRVEEYAGDIFNAICLAESGYSMSVRHFDWNDPTLPKYYPPSLSPSFTVERAEEYGYHRSPLSPFEKGQLEVLRKLQDLDSDPDLAAAWDSCDARRMSEEPFLSYYGITDVALYVNGIEELPQVRAAAKEWRQCMSDLGIPDLPEMPGVAESLQEEFGLNTQVGISLDTAAEESSPSEKEIRIAVQDAKCRETSRFEQLVYDAEWAAEEERIAKNPEEFAARLEEISKGTQAYKDYIAENS